jgi:3-oxoacyl-[acyl-carrier-protein] synthase II
MPSHKIYISDYDCLSPAGQGPDLLMKNLFAGRSLLHSHPDPLGKFPHSIDEKIAALRLDKSFKDQDKTSLSALLVARRISALWDDDSRKRTGVILGSSRGPTETLENAWKRHHEGQRLSPTTSPSTTASALPSVVARDLRLEGPSLALSAACSTGLYAIIQGASNLISHLSHSLIVGGVEAANTSFTLDMLKASRVLAPANATLFPCRPGHPERAGMVLSEGAALLHIETIRRSDSKAEIVGWGAATESATLTGVSPNGDALQRAVKNALAIAGVDSCDVDFIVGHGAGTFKGDAAELEAYKAVFEKTPPLVWHKWCSGHMLGASAALSVMLTCEHLKTGQLPPHPYMPEDHPMRAARTLKEPKVALISSMGFGGSACALVVKTLV